MRPERAATIVSVTPLPLGRDSRTLKQAMTLARLGYTSVVVADRTRWDMNPAQPPEFPPERSTSEDRTAPRPGRFPSRFDRLPAVLQLPRFLYWLARYVRRYVWQAAAQLPRASLYCLHEFSSFPAVWIAARMAGAPIVYDAHDFYSQMVEDSERTPFERRFIAPFQRWLERACIRRAAAVLTVSEGVGELMQQRFGIEPVIVRNCHDSRLDRPVRSGLRDRLGLRGDDFLLVAIGNAKQGYAADVAIEAMQRLPARVHLALVGDGYRGYAGRIRAKGLSSRVHLAGFLPPTEVVPAVRDADAAVILYYARSADYQAALPNKLFQSIAAELPVLYPDLPQIASVMRAAGAGLCIDAQNPSSIVRAVERLMQDRDAAGTAAVRRRLRDQWAWETEERLFAEQVRRCLREARPLPAARASRRRGQREPMTTAERGMTVDDVRRFWEGHPVAAAAIPAERGTAQYFAAYDRLREANESLEFSHALHEYRQFKGQTVLDVGCGNGYVLGKYAAEGARAFGVDLTGAGIALCRRRFALQGLSGQFTVGNAEALPFPDEFFDCACSMGVLHHTPAPQAAVDELYRVLKPGGRLIIMMYHRNSATYRLQMFANRLRTGRAMDELVRSIDGAGNPIGDVYSKAELRRLLGRFADVECFAGCLQREMLPKLGRVIPESWLRRLGRRWGWFLYAKARKPRRQGL